MAEVRSCYSSQRPGLARRPPDGDRKSTPSPALLSAEAIGRLAAFDLTAALRDGLTTMVAARHSRVLALRLGVADSPPLRLHAIGVELGVSRERVRQLEERAVPRLLKAMKQSDGGRQAIEVASTVVAPSEEGWEDRVVAVADLLLPDAPATVVRRVVMALGGVRASATQQKAVREREATPASRRSETTMRATRPSRRAPPESGPDEHQPEDPPAGETGAVSAAEAVSGRFGIRVRGGPARFVSPGWFFVGTTVADCPACGVVLEGFRAPYRTKAGVLYHYWALACLKCARLWTPHELGDEAKHDVYASSDLRPSSPPRAMGLGSSSSHGCSPASP